MTKGRLEGKVCVVTGGGTRSEGMGTGRAAAVLFAREGGMVAVADLNKDAADFTVKLIEDEGGEAFSFAADLTSSDEAKALADATVDRWGRIDVLDNNIGIGSRGSVVDCSDEVWDRVFAINIRSTVNASRHIVPIMAAQGGGSIINLSSISAVRPRGLTAYTTAKGAVIALTRAMAVDHGEQGIRVNCIAPGPIFTPMAAASGDSHERRERRRLASLLKIEGDAWDIAHACVYFASDESRYVTGQTLLIDGGVSVSSPAR